MHTTVAFFLVWVTFSFLAHKLAKEYFHSVSIAWIGSQFQTEDTLTMAGIIVTGAQFLCCALLTFVKTSKPPVDPTNFKNKEPSWGVLLMIAVPHTIGTLATNYSMALIPASSTHLIKVMEPMVTASMAWLVVGVPISSLKLLSIGLVIIGAVGTSWDLLSTSHIDRLGLQLAMLSNLVYAMRNVTIKHLLGENTVFNAASMGKVSLMGVIMLIPCCCILASTMSGIILQCDVLTLCILGGTALCYTTYTYVSTCVILQYITVIGHAVANVAKRVLVIVLLYILGQKYSLSPAFVMLCCIGLVLYVVSSSRMTLHVTSATKYPTAINSSLNGRRIMIIFLTIASVAAVGITEKVIFEKCHQQRLIDQPENTDKTMKNMHTASTTILEAQRIQLQIYRELIGHYKKAILVGLADQQNLGDSAINVGELEALKKLGIEVVYVCSSQVCRSSLDQAKQAVMEQEEPVVVLASGGGNFCIWNTECALREKLTIEFPDLEIVVFPQSVKFDNFTQMVQHAVVMNKHPNLTYLFRDHQSYDKIVKSGYFHFKRAVLCPDAAMQIGNIRPPKEPTHDILWLKREDKESKNSRLKVPEFPTNVSVYVKDWIRTSTPRRFKNITQLSYDRLKIAFEFLSIGKVVISDRLHAHILSVLLGKPSVIIDNSYKKLTSFHNTWTPGVDNVLIASNITDAITKAQYLLNKYY